MEEAYDYGAVVVEEAYDFGPVVVAGVVLVDAVVVAAIVAAAAAVANMLGVVVVAVDIVVVEDEQYRGPGWTTLAVFSRPRHDVYVLRQHAVLPRAGAVPLLVVAFARQLVAVHIAFEPHVLLVDVVVVPLLQLQQPPCAAPLPQPPFDVGPLPSDEIPVRRLRLSDEHLPLLVDGVPPRLLLLPPVDAFCCILPVELVFRLRRKARSYPWVDQQSMCRGFELLWLRLLILFVPFRPY